MFYKSVQTWLIIGVVMILLQIVIGGVTRLTGSGLSITKWEIVTGTLPPLTEDAWMVEFDLYKSTPQYKKINKGMSLKQFKFIYFWEYLHRLWARSIGFVFLFPFLWFVRKRMLSKYLVRRLFTAVLLGAIVAAFGWIMVKSGLVERPWVNAYKLVLHLGLGVMLLSYLIYVAADYWLNKHHTKRMQFRTSTKLLSIFLILLFVQILLGGLMSGMRAALFYPTWPLIGSEWIPGQLLQFENWSFERFIHYDQDAFAPAVIHVIHRNFAYLITILYLVMTWRDWNNKYIRYGMIFLLIQIVLGIMTTINSIGAIPVFWGALHQLVGIMLFGYLLYLRMIRRRMDKEANVT